MRPRNAYNGGLELEPHVEYGFFTGLLAASAGSSRGGQEAGLGRSRPLAGSNSEESLRTAPQSGRDCARAYRRPYTPSARTSSTFSII